MKMRVENPSIKTKRTDSFHLQDITTLLFPT